MTVVARGTSNTAGESGVLVNLVYILASLQGCKDAVNPMALYIHVVV